MVIKSGPMRDIPVTSDVERCWFDARLTAQYVGAETADPECVLYWLLTKNNRVRTRLESLGIKPNDVTPRLEGHFRPELPNNSRRARIMFLMAYLLQRKRAPNDPSVDAISLLAGISLTGGLAAEILKDFGLTADNLLRGSVATTEPETPGRSRKTARHSAWQRPES